jgi:hypothetical protein
MEGDYSKNPFPKFFPKHRRHSLLTPGTAENGGKKKARFAPGTGIDLAYPIGSGRPLPETAFLRCFDAFLIMLFF